MKSAFRTLDLLEALAKAPRALTHAELAQRTAIPKSSLSQLLHTLQVRGYVEPLGPHGPFRLGRAALHLIGHGLDVQRIAASAQPCMEALSQEAGYSSGLNVLSGDFVERVRGVTAPLGFAMHEGVRAPLYASSSGKLYLARMKEDDVEAYLSRTVLRPITKRSVHSCGDLRQQIVRARAEGVAYSREEFTNGVVGLSVPVLDVHTRMIACLGLAVPATDFESKRKMLVALLRDFTGQISGFLDQRPAA